MMSMMCTATPVATSSVLRASEMPCIPPPSVLPLFHFLVSGRSSRITVTPIRVSVCGWPPMSSRRPSRGAAVKAREKLEAAPIVIGSSEGESSNDEGEEGEEGEEEEEEEEKEVQPLSAYELERKSNIERNQAVLASLGLAGPHASSSRSPASGASGAGGGGGSRGHKRAGAPKAGRSKQARSSQPQRSPSIASASSSGDDGPVDEVSSTITAAPGKGHRRKANNAAVRATTSSQVGNAVERLEDADVVAFFELLRGGPASGLLHASSVHATCKKLQLDSKGAFSPAAVERLMVDAFDGGKGALSLDDFRRIVAQCGLA